MACLRISPAPSQLQPFTGSAPLPSHLYPQRKLHDAQDAHSAAADSHSSAATALAARLRDVERALGEAQAAARAAREGEAAARAAATDRDLRLAEAAGGLKQVEAQRASAEAGKAALAEQLAAEQRQRQELAAAVEQLQARLAAGVRGLEAEGEARQRAEAAAAAAREALADEQKRRALDEAAWERRLRELQEDAGARLATREAKATAAAERAAAEAAAALEDSRRQLTKRLYLAEGEWAKRLQASAADWGALRWAGRGTDRLALRAEVAGGNAGFSIPAEPPRTVPAIDQQPLILLPSAAARLDGVGAEWAQRCEADKAAWAAERTRLQHEMEARLAEAAAAQAAAVEETKQAYRRRLAAAEAKAEAAVQATERVWQQRLEAATARAEGERQATADGQAAAAAQREQQLVSQLAAAQQGAAASLAEQDKTWALRLAAAEERGLKVGACRGGVCFHTSIMILVNTQTSMAPRTNRPTPAGAPCAGAAVRRARARRRAGGRRGAGHAARAAGGACGGGVGARGRPGAAGDQAGAQARYGGQGYRWVAGVDQASCLSVASNASRPLPCPCLLHCGHPSQLSCCARWRRLRPRARESAGGARRWRVLCRWAGSVNGARGPRWLPVGQGMPSHDVSSALPPAYSWLLRAVACLPSPLATCDFWRLQEASAIFRRELADKNQQLELLRQELK